MKIQYANALAAQQSLRWSEDNRVAVVTGHIVTVTDPSCASSVAAAITVKRSDEPITSQDVIFPPGFPEAPRPALIRAAEWSPALDGTCLLLAITTLGKACIYKETVTPNSAWTEVADISSPELAWRDGVPVGPGGLIALPAVAEAAENDDGVMETPEVACASYFSAIKASKDEIQTLCSELKNGKGAKRKRTDSVNGVMMAMVAMAGGVADGSCGGGGWSPTCGAWGPALDGETALLAVGAWGGFTLWEVTTGASTEVRCVACCQGGGEVGNPVHGGADGEYTTMAWLKKQSGEAQQLLTGEHVNL